MNNFKEFRLKKLFESSLSRIYNHIKDNNIGIISAYRDMYTSKENFNRHKELLKLLYDKGIINVIQLKGYWVEKDSKGKEKEVNELSFFVYNEKGDDNFEKLKNVLYELASENHYRQECILLKKWNEDFAFLLGTSESVLIKRKNGKIRKSFNVYPGKDEIKKVGKFTPGKLNSIYSRINGRPFIFESLYYDRETYGSFLSALAHSVKKKNFENSILNEKLLKESVEEDGFWVNGKKIYTLNGKTHIDYILSNPSKFGLDREYIEKLYSDYSEKLGVEGKAREEIIKDVSKKGWVRIRFYEKRDTWSIQFDKWILRKKTVINFVLWSIAENNMNPNSTLTLSGFDDNFYKKYSFMEGGAKSVLNEYKKFINNSIIDFKIV